VKPERHCQPCVAHRARAARSLPLQWCTLNHSLCLLCKNGMLPAPNHPSGLFLMRAIACPCNADREWWSRTCPEILSLLASLACKNRHQRRRAWTAPLQIWGCRSNFSRISHCIYHILAYRNNLRWKFDYSKRLASSALVFTLSIKRITQLNSQAANNNSKPPLF